MSFCILVHWKEFFEKTDIDEPHVSEYVDIFIRNYILPSSVSELREDHLTKMGITLLGHQLAILKCVKEVSKICISRITFLSSLFSNDINVISL